MNDETNAASVEAPQTESLSTESAERPEYIPEKFWDADENSTNVEALARGYSELERFVGKKRDEVREEVINQYQSELNENRPESPDKYVASFTDDSPFKEIEDQLDYENDPLIRMWSETAHKAGLSNEDFTLGVEAYLQSLSAGPDIEAEISSLGENGKARVEAVDMWAQRNLDENQYQSLAQMTQTAGAIEALEALMNSTKSAQTNAFNPEAVSSKPDREEIESMMNDPKYWDPARRDKSYVRQVENMVRRASA